MHPVPLLFADSLDGGRQSEETIDHILSGAQWYLARASEWPVVADRTRPTDPSPHPRRGDGVDRPEPCSGARRQVPASVRDAYCCCRDPIVFPRVSPSQTRI